MAMGHWTCITQMLRHDLIFKGCDFSTRWTRRKEFHKVWLLCFCIKVFKILISLFVRHLALHCQYIAGCQASSESGDRDKVWSYTKCANLVRSRTADWEPGEWTGHITSSQPQLWPPICVLSVFTHSVVNSFYPFNICTVVTLGFCALCYIL